MRIENQTILKADEGMYLTNGETFASVVYLGTNDKAENWHEVTEAEKSEIEAKLMSEVEEKESLN